MKRLHVLTGMLAVAAMLALAFASPATSNPADGRHGKKPAISVARAPIVPDGTTEYADPDFVVTFADKSPFAPGIGIKAGGAISLQFPPDFIQEDPAAPMTMVVLQGWAQSPRLPFPTPSYDAATHTLTGVMGFDYLPMGSDGPGPKQLHVILPGFTNPKRGIYPLKLTIQQDPADPTTLVKEGTVRIVATERPSINAINVINGAPPPPFPNSVWQRTEVGEKPLLWGFYLWDEDKVPYVGVSLEKKSANRYALVDEHGRTIGKVKIRAPRGASGYFIDAADSVAANAAVLGIPTGLMTAQFHPDTDTPGHYVISWKLKKGNKQRMFLTVEPKHAPDRVAVVREWTAEGNAAPGDEVVGKSDLRRTAKGLEAWVVVRGLRPGGVYTFWWVVVQDDGDFPGDIHVQRGAGTVVGDNGKAVVHMAAQLGDAAIKGFPPLGDMQFDSLRDPEGSLIRVEIAYHGQAKNAGANLTTWLSDFWTGAACPPDLANPNPEQPHCPVYYAATHTP